MEGGVVLSTVRLDRCLYRTRDPETETTSAKCSKSASQQASKLGRACSTWHTDSEAIAETKHTMADRNGTALSDSR